MAQASPTGTRDLDFLIESAKKEPDSAILQRLDRMVQTAVTHPVRRAWEQHSSIAYHFREGQHYTPDELAAFRERKQAPTTRNEIAPIMERFTGQLVQTRQVATFLGRNTPADDLLGDLSRDYLRFTDQLNMYEFEEQALVDDGLTGGQGWLWAEPKRDESGQMFTRLRARNPYTIFKDPYSTRYDPNEDGECKYIIEGRWMDLEDAIATWPDKANQLKQMYHGHAYDLESFTEVESGLRNEAMAIYLDKKRHRIRPFVTWYKRKMKLYHLFKDDRLIPIPIPLDSAQADEVISVLDGEATKKPIFVERMHVGVHVAGLLIHHDFSPHRTNLFPYVPFYYHIKKNGEPQGLAERLVPIVESINKRSSQSLRLMSNRQTIAERGAVRDVEQHQMEKAKPDGFIEVESGALSGGRVQIQHNLDLGQGQMQLLQEDKDALRRVSGFADEAMGMPSEVRSGVGIRQKQMMTNFIVKPTVNNLRRTRYMKARLCFAYQQQYLTEEVAFQLTDDPNAARTVTISQQDIAALKERTYDIVITDSKDWSTVREEQAELLMGALPQLAQYGSWLVKLAVQLSDIPNKDSFMRMIDEQNQPQPVVPKLSLAMSWQELTPEERAYMAMTAFKSPELAQAIMQDGSDPAFVQKLKTALAQTQIKEGTRATVERGKVDYLAAQTAMEGMLRSREIFAEKSVPGQPGAEEPGLPPGLGV